MTRYVALLRGIAPMNPNMHNAKLRAVLEELGFAHVRTVLSSGNVLFAAPEAKTAKQRADLEARLEAAWPEKLGFQSASIIRSLEDLQSLADHEPFAGYTHGPATSLNVTFLQQPQPAGKLSGHGFRIVAQYPGEICSIVDLTSAKTPDFMRKVEQAYGKRITTRSWKTVERIIAALAQMP